MTNDLEASIVRISKVSRVAIAAVLAVSAVAALGGPAGAGAAPSGSLTANGSGGVVVEWDGTPESYIVLILEAGTACPVGTPSDPYQGPLPGLVGAVPGGFFGPTPITLEVGSEILGNGVGPSELTAGTYQFCLGEVVTVDDDEGFVPVEELEAELSEPAPPTTAAPTTTTTAEAAVVPAAPRFTG